MQPRKQPPGIIWRFFELEHAQLCLQIATQQETEEPRQYGLELRVSKHTHFLLDSPICLHHNPKCAGIGTSIVPSLSAYLWSPANADRSNIRTFSPRMQSVSSTPDIKS